MTKRGDGRSALARAVGVRGSWVAALIGVGLLVPSVASAASVYVANSSPGTVSTFSIGATGALTQQGTGTTSGSSTNSDPCALVVSPNGQYLYVANSYLGTVSTFAIGSGGAITQQGTGVATSTSTGSTQPDALAISPSGEYLYVANTNLGTVSTFAIGSDGALTREGSGTVSGTGSSSDPDALAVSPNGEDLYATNLNLGTVSTFAIGASGALTQQGTGVTTGPSMPSTSPYPDGLAVSPNGQYLYVANSGLGTVSTFAIAPGGSLTQQGTGVLSGSLTTSNPDALAVSPNGQYLYAANEEPGTVSTFVVGSDGALTQQGTGVMSGSGGGSEPWALALSPTGQHLYVANAGLGSVSTFAVGSGGALTQQGTGVISGPSGSSSSSYPYSVAVSPDQGPTAAFSATSAPAGSASTFSASGSAGGSEPVTTYTWEFGDGATATGAQASHVYAAAGTYTATLTLVDSDGCSRFGPFTGQSPYCTLDPAASVSHTITVPAAVVPTTTTTTTTTTTPTTTTPTATVAPTTSSRTVTFDNQRLTLTTPASSPCQAATGKLAVSLTATTLAHGTKLRLKLAAAFLDKGVEHTHTRKVRRHDKTVTVKVTSYAANATATKLPVSRQLALTGLKAGTHTLTVKLTYDQTKVVTVKHGRKRVKVSRAVAVTKTITAKFTVC